MTDFIASYREYLTEEKHSSANTLSSYIRDLTQFQSWLLSTGVTDMRKVKKDTINEYLLHMTHSGKSPATVTRSTASIKSFYAYMAQCGAVKTNPAKSVVAMKVERKYPEILTNREVELFLEQPKCVDEKGFRDHAMLELLYATGIRVSELIGLDVNDVNLSVGFVRCRSKEKERIVPLYPAAVKALEDYVRDIRPRLIADEEGNALFVNMSGERMSRQGFWKIIKYYQEKAGIEKDITPHTPVSYTHLSAGWTDIFIYPGYRFKVTDALITNFHLPESTLIMLVSALAGREHILNAYRQAVEERYRFFSFGDAMFIS